MPRSNERAASGGYTFWRIALPPAPTPRSHERRLTAMSASLLPALLHSCIG